MLFRFPVTAEYHLLLQFFFRLEREYISMGTAGIGDRCIPYTLPRSATGVNMATGTENMKDTKGMKDTNDMSAMNIMRNIMKDTIINT
jgi:hypothetical protein